MATEVYLAMTAADFCTGAPVSVRTGWLDCHFSPEERGLAGIPPALPAGSLLVLTDRLPIDGHDPLRIAGQLDQALAALDCRGLLLDFQRPGVQEAAELAAYLVCVLSCPVAVSEPYAPGLDCPVFLSPCPHHTHLKEHIAPWAGREVWLDLAVDGEVITLTPKGADISPLSLGNIPEGGHREESLHCHYAIETGADFARFTLWRTREDAQALAREAEGLGVRTLVGLWREWNSAA